jgi:hypothetical protein
VKVTLRDLVVAGVGVAAGFLVSRFLAQRKKDSAERLQEAADDTEYWKYKAKHDAIRTKYDPRNEWNETTSLPPRYLADIRNLNLTYRAVLKRRNGWMDHDFE